MLWDLCNYGLNEAAIRQPFLLVDGVLANCIAAESAEMACWSGGGERGRLGDSDVEIDRPRLARGGVE